MPDIDIDFADRSIVLNKIKHIPASIINDDEIKKHNTGVYCHSIPVNPFTNTANLDYKIADQRGYFKFDLLNVSLYQQISSEEKLIELMHREPAWHKLYDSEYCSKLMHIGNHYDLLISMPEAVTNIERMAMFLALIRPNKRHLIGLPWDRVAETVWIKDANGGYAYKRAHAISYAHLVVVHMNLLDDSSD